MTPDFGKYKILSEIGRGGMGIVYQAFDSTENRIVAIKSLVMENIGPEKMREFRDRFRREAVTIQRLKHPNIVEVFDVATDAGTYYYVMEFLEGHSLRRELEIRQGKMTAKEYWPLLDQVASALDFAHTMNVVHRDVKPDNIFILKDGRVKITDFGIARAVDFEETKLTKTGVMLGTLAYVSPEQLQDAKNVDHRADIFSLGVVSYESLSGQIPFSGEGIAATIVKIVSLEEKPLHILNPEVKVETAACVAKAMRKKARERYRSVRDFARDFESSLSNSMDEHLRVQMEGQKTAENISALPPDYKPSYAFDKSDSTFSGSFSGASSTNSAETYPKYPTPGDQHFDARRQTESLYPSQSQSHERYVPAPSKGKRITFIKVQGKQSAAFIEPSLVAFKSGKLVVADTATRKLHVFSKDGRWVGDLAQMPDRADSRTRGGNITKPSGIAIDDRGRFYVSDSSDQFVRVFDASGVFLRDFKNTHGTEGGLTGIAVDSTGLIYTSDSNNGCVQVFQSDMGTWMRKLGSKGEGRGQFQLPCALTVDRLNQIYCVDYGLSRVSIFSKTGSLVRAFGEKGQGPGQFNVPRSIVVDKNDKIYVLDAHNNRIQVFSPTGDHIYTIGEKGSEPGQFLGPSDITLDTESNTIYVADKGNKRIQVIELER